MAIRQKTFVQLRAKGAAVSHSRTNVHVGHNTTVIDEPEVRGGTNAGLSPTETAVAALIGCTNVISHKVADKMGLKIKAMDIAAEVDFDRRGVTLQEEIDVPFTAVRLKVEIATDASQADVDTLAAETAKFCPLSKLYKQAGAKIEENWTIRGQ